MLIFIFGMIVALILVANLVIAKRMTAKEMLDDFWVDQNVVGKIFANIFYLPAWVLKILKAIFDFVNK